MPANPNLLPVSEVAREAAAAVYAGDGDGGFAHSIKRGKHDGDPLVQAFAAFEQSKDAAFVAMLEGMKRELDPIAYGSITQREAARNAVIDEAIANAKAMGRAGS